MMTLSFNYNEYNDFCFFRSEDKFDSCFPDDDKKTKSKFVFLGFIIRSRIVHCVTLYYSHLAYMY